MGGTTYPFRCHYGAAMLLKFINALVVITKVLLATNEYNRHPRAEVLDFREPLNSFMFSFKLIRVLRDVHTFSATFPRDPE